MYPKRKLLRLSKMLNEPSFIKRNEAHYGAEKEKENITMRGKHAYFRQ